ncbi:hypothetical protein K661_02066 [Piscirickettsia salmonis LF-89 = ATCC VR-1361]|nr:hypothetical protein K661_02066 [Piscirickettsia salmonis LF-89 = ATCC VR-1361]
MQNKKVNLVKIIAVIITKLKTMDKIRYQLKKYLILHPYYGSRVFGL